MSIVALNLKTSGIYYSFQSFVVDLCELIAAPSFCKNPYDKNIYLYGRFAV